jgi:hypothetical protein
MPVEAWFRTWALQKTISLLEPRQFVGAYAPGRTRVF